MGKPSKWFNKLLRRCRRRKTVPENTTAAADGGVPGDIDYYGGGNGGVEESNKHAIAVAAATAAVAEAAFAAAKAAAEVVRLTSNNVSRRRLFLDELAAVKIQSVFRGYLARRALKALKGLVKLQALVRGYFVRKQSADMLLRLQAMVRVQARARSSRALSIESSSHCSPAKVNQSKPGISEDSEHSSVLKRCGSNSSVRDTATSWLDNWVTDEKNAKIVEIVDSYTPESNPRARNRNNHISDDTTSLKSVQFPREKRAQFSGASRTGSMRITSPKTPLRDEYTRSYYHNSYGSPSYMCNTQSSRAKSRSHSVPRYRVIEPEKLGSIKRSLHAFWDSKTSSKRSSESFSNMAKQRW